MLTPEDLNFIKSNRKDIEQLRTDPVTLKRHAVVGRDFYTDEPTIEEVTEVVWAIVKGFTGIEGGERLLVNGVAVQTGDVSISFDYSISLEGVQTLEHHGVVYTLYDVQERGIGTPNRNECIARRVT